jgi:hypothetical protein
MDDHHSLDQLTYSRWSCCVYALMTHIWVVGHWRAWYRTIVIWAWSTPNTTAVVIMCMWRSSICKTPQDNRAFFNRDEKQQVWCNRLVVIILSHTHHNLHEQHFICPKPPPKVRRHMCQQNS